jgi:histidinol dehydrogenase
MINIIKDSINDVSKGEVEKGTEIQRQAVIEIINEVKVKGDEALRSLSARFDKVHLNELRVSKEEMLQAEQEIDQKTITALKKAMAQIGDFHQRQRRQSWLKTNEETGAILGQMIRPMDRVAVYVPGGSAPLVSTVLMNVIPAQIAGVKQIVMFTPPQPDGKVNAGILYAALLLGIEEVYKVGGAQAIAAAAYGTESIKSVDKIVGPGNIYVALAKREVFGTVDIDMIAGPSDICVLADENQNPAFIAADMLSQAEHDPLSAAILVTPSEALAEAVLAELKRQMALLPRREIAEASLSNKGAIYVTKSLEEAIARVNWLAPEHLEVLVEEPFSILPKIRHAGAIFLGPYSPEPVGDYMAGPNHVLPTNGTARFSSPLSVDDFIKKSSVIYYTKQAFMQDAKEITTLARYEGLEAHAQAIEVRLKEEEKYE